jgi:hypothetical protein
MIPTVLAVCLVRPRACGAGISADSRKGRLALRDVLQELDTHVVELDPALLVNVNPGADPRALTP